MATNNSNIKTYDLDSVFAAYKEFFKAKLEKTIKELEEKAKTRETRLKIETNKKTAKEAELEAKEAELEAKKAELNKIFPLFPYNDLIVYNNTKTEYEDKQKTLEELNKKDTSKMTQEELDAHTKEVNTINAYLNNNETSYNEAVNAINNYFKCERALKPIIDASNKIYEEIKQINSAIEDINAEEDNLKKAKENLNKINNENNNLPATYAGTVETFTKFLEENNLSTIHAAEIFNAFTTNEITYNFTKDEIKMRKEHPIRDALIKKGAIPTALTVGGTAIGFGALAGSGLIGGSTFFGFIPVMSNMAITHTLTALTGAGIGALAATAIIVGKKLGTIAYYNIRYKSGKGNLQDYTEGIELENLQLTKLIDKIKATQIKILEAKGLNKIILNVVNRNRIHQVEQITKDLADEFIKYSNDATIAKEVKLEKLEPIYDLLKSVQSFVSDDIKKSITHALLTCTQSGEHTHASVFENVDIYSNLKMYLNTVKTEKTDVVTRKKQEKDAKSVINNIPQKKNVALGIINGERLIPQMLAYEDMLPPVSRAVNVVSRTIDAAASTVTITLANGQTHVLPLDEIASSNVVSVEETPSRLILNMEDGSTRTIKTSEPKNHSEIYIVSSKIKERLDTDKDFVNTLKTKYNYKTITINNLKEILNKWLAENKDKVTSTLSLKGKTKNAYKECVAIIKAESVLSV